MNNTFKTGDARADFVLRNYSAIVDLLECQAIAERKIPAVLQKDIKLLVDKLGYREAEIDAEGVSFCPDGKFWSEQDGVGIFFYFYVDWDSLDAEDAEAGVNLGIYKERIGAKKYISWLTQSQKALAAKKTMLMRKGIEVPTNDAEGCLAAQYIGDLLNLRTLSTEDYPTIRQKLEKSIRNFTETFVGKKGLLKPLFP